MLPPAARPGYAMGLTPPGTSCVHGTAPRMGRQTGTLAQVRCREIKKLNRAESHPPLDKGQEHLQHLKEQLAACRGADLSLGRGTCRQTVPSSGSRHSVALRGRRRAQGPPGSSQTKAIGRAAPLAGQPVCFSCSVGNW